MPDTVRYLKAAFQRWPKTANGIVELDDLRSLFAGLDGPLHPEELEALLRAADANRTGVIRVDDFLDWLFAPRGFEQTPGTEQTVGKASNTGACQEPMFASTASKSITFWKPSGEQVCRVPPEAAHRGQMISSLIFTSTGLIASAGYDGSVVLWDSSGRQLCRKELGGSEKAVFSLAAARDGCIVVGGRRTLALWSTGTEKMTELWRNDVPHGTGMVRTLACAFDGRLASGSSDGSIAIWNHSDDGLWCIPKEDVHKGKPVTALAFSGTVEDGCLASGSDKGSVVLFDISGAKTKELKRYEKRTASVTALAFSTNGCLAIGREDDVQSLELWDHAEEKPKRAVQVPHSGWTERWIVSLFFIGSCLFAGCCDGSVTIWDDKSYQVKQRLTAMCQFEHVNAFAFSNSIFL